ncbi:MAG: MBL fold metallo-hydrolase [Coriobacteriia bacterium]|nr:MBL fold metallo-hydrolase [Coriobacteriia bacterium]
MRLTVLGSGASYPGPGRACAGYLVEDDGAAVLLDCGNGAASNLARVLRPEALGAVFITHAHVDHFADVYVLQAALRYAPDGPAGPVDMFAAPGVLEALLAPLSERGRRDMSEAFAARELRHGVPVFVGGLAVEPIRTTHAGETLALDIRDCAGRRIVYTSDSVASPALADAARGADLLLADATLPEEYAGKAPHMTAREAGALARAAGVEVLVLTHLWPSVDRSQAARDAGCEFGGRIIVAEEMMAIDLVEEV